MVNILAHLRRVYGAKQSMDMDNGQSIILKMTGHP